MAHRHKDSRLKWTTTDAEPEISHPADTLTAAEVTTLKLIAGGGGGTTPVPNPPPTPPPDITAPVISGIAQVVTTTTATITWTTNEATTGVVQYGSTTGYGTTTAATSSGTSHSRTLTGLTPGQTYQYQVRATDAAPIPNVGLSGNRSFTTTASPTLPGAPTGLTATGGNTQVTLNWTAPASNGGSAITGYRVYRNGASLITLGVVLTYNNTGLTNGLTYTYTVAAITAVGEGPQSASAFATPSAGGDINPPVPTNIVVSSITTTSVQVSWSQLEAGSGQVEYGTSTGYGLTTTLEPSFLTAHSQPITALNPGTLYHFRVKTLDAASNVGYSSDRTFTTTSTPVPPPSGTIYGSGVGGDSLGNTNVGGAGTFKQYCRFRAEQSSALSTVRFYYLGPPDPGYALGTGGTWRLQVFADDGTSNHFPTGSALATQNVAAAMGAAAGKLITFSSPYTPTAGTLYHLIFENTDASPNANYFGVDYWIYGAMPNGSGQINPRFADTDWGHGFYNDPAGPWEARAGYAPVLDIGYANGQHQGMSYGEASYSPGQVGQINGSSLMVRELFTVAGGSRTVTGAGIRLLKIAGGTDALTVRLEDSAGTLIDSFTIAAASIATGPAPYLGSVWDDLGRNAKWVTGSFASPRVLANGTTYRLRLSTASGTTYWAWVNRRLSHGYGYSPVTAFTSGNAEKTTNGSTWTSLGRASGENDLQFYFSL